jgi:KDO2-lipid IV(A) lauroyltransferase
MAAGRPRKRKTGGKIRDALFNALLPPLLWLLGRCSERSLGRIAALAANLARIVHPGGHRLIEANLAIAFPELPVKARRRLARDNMRQTIWMGLDVISHLRHPERLRSRVIAPELQLFRNDGGKPCIFCLPHLGNWELFGQAVPLFGIKAAAVARTFSNRRLTELLFRTRQSSGLAIIPHRGAARGVLKALRNGYNIGLLVDQNVSPSRGGVYANFFGLPAPTSRLPAMLARRLELPVFVGACVRGADGMLYLDREPLAKAVSDYPDDASLTQDLLRATEALVRRHPEQYIWHYRRWRRIPGNIPADLAARFPYYAAERPNELCPEELFASPQTASNHNQETPKE